MSKELLLGTKWVGSGSRVYNPTYGAGTFVQVVEYAPLFSGKPDVVRVDLDEPYMDKEGNVSSQKDVFSNLLKVIEDEVRVEPSVTDVVTAEVVVAI